MVPFSDYVGLIVGSYGKHADISEGSSSPIRSCKTIAPIFSFNSWRMHIFSLSLLQTDKHMKKNHVELKSDTSDKASALHISKGKLPFSFRFLVLVLNVCVRQPFCDAETFYLSSMGRKKKRRSFQMCV